MNFRLVLILPLLIATLSAAVSCETKKEIVLPGKTAILPVLNAQLTASETYHEVFYSLSGPLSEQASFSTTPVIEVTVNEHETITCQHDLAYYSFTRDKRFQPGDRLRIEARTDALSCSAETTVPEAIPVISIDTARVINRSLFDSEEHLQFQLKIARKEDAYFRIRGIGQKGDEVRTLSFQAVSVAPASSFFSTINYYLVFSEEDFEGEREHTFLLNLKEAYPLEGFEARLYVESISFEEYYYLKALNNMETFGYTNVMFVEPTTLPSNVVGGLGMVSVLLDTPAPKTFILP